MVRGVWESCSKQRDNMKNKKSWNNKVLSDSRKFCLWKVVHRGTVRSGPCRSHGSSLDSRLHTTKPLGSICGSSGWSFIRPHLSLCLWYQSDLWRRPLEMMRARNGAATAPFTQHILSVQSKGRNPLLSDNFVLRFYFSCFWISMLFWTLLFGNATYLEWNSVSQPKTWVVWFIRSELQECFLLLGVSDIQSLPLGSGRSPGRLPFRHLRAQPPRAGLGLWTHSILTDIPAQKPLRSYRIVIHTLTRSPGMSPGWKWVKFWTLRISLFVCSGKARAEAFHRDSTSGFWSLAHS